MIKYYLFKASGPINVPEFKNGLDAIDEDYSLSLSSPDEGFFTAPEKFAVRLQGVLFPLHDDLGITISVLACHADGALERKSLKEALSYFPNQCLFLSDILMKEFSFGDYSSLPLLKEEMKKVPHELLLTAGAFLRCGLNASLAAESLFIHRNTFNYRLSQFIDSTGLDIRDYHNALLLEIYFQLGESTKRW